MTTSGEAELNAQAQDPRLRIGTWNMDGRWDPSHRELLLSANCDVWLLTEVNPDVELPDFECHLTSGVTSRGQHWAGIFGRQPPVKPLPQPHIASAAAVINGVTFVASILPWKGLQEGVGWRRKTHRQRTRYVVDRLMSTVLTKQVVWGGDWNHGIFGPESAGQKGSRLDLFNALSRLELNVPTAHLPHQIPGLLSIDHVAIPPWWTQVAAERIPAEGLSDHDCYVVEACPTAAADA